MNFRRFILYSIVVLAPVALVAQTQASIIMCKNKKIVRTLRIMQMEPDNKCITMYTKAGTDKIVGSGKSMSTCTTVTDNIKGNLEKAGWKCKEATADVISHYNIQ